MINVLFGALLLSSSFTIGAADKKAEDLLGAYAKKISSVKSLVVDTEAYKGASSAGKASFTFARPDFVRIETPGKVQVFDGKNYSELFTSSRQYFTRQARAGELSGLLSSDNVVAWGVFFTKDVSRYVKAAAYDGKDTVQKQTFDCVKVTIDAKANKTARLYIDPADSLVKHVEFSVGGNTAKTMVLSSKFEVDSVADGSALAQMPADAKQVSEDELVGLKWYTDFNAAMEAAKASNKIVFCDFYADW